MACQHTPPREAAATIPYLEQKQKPDGTVREYPCRLLRRRRGLVIIRFTHPAGASAFITPVPIPPGSVSDGYFWASRPYNLYRMREPSGRVAAHRFDAVTDVRITEDHVSYRDLVLDWWVLPDGTILDEDRDELEALTAAHALSAADQATALRAEQQVWSRYRHIIDEAAELERRLRL